MQIHQADFRTVLIRKGGLAFYLRYSLYQDGEERFPESINCREDTTVAYFLTSTIRDFLRETPWGFAVERTWSIVPEGQFALSFCVDLPDNAAHPLLLPGVAAASETTAEGMWASGWDTALPNAAYVSTGNQGVLVFSDPVLLVPPGPQAAAGALGPGCVSVQRVVVDEETVVRTEIRVPDPHVPALPASRRSSRRGRSGPAPLPGSFFTQGDYQQKLRLNVALAAANLTFVQGLRAVGDRLTGRLHPPARLGREDCRGLAEETVRECLDRQLFDQKGAFGLRTVPGAAELSAAAGLGLACLLIEAFPDREESVETASRLADFALKGQHPGGLFYGTYFVGEGSWLPPGTGPDSPPRVSLEAAAEVACLLLRFGEALRGLGRPADRYLLAPERMARALLASRDELTELGDTVHPDSLLPVAPSPGCLTLIELFLSLLRLFGRDAYKKALSALLRQFHAQGPPGSPAALTESDRSAPAFGEEVGPLSLEQALQEGRIAALLLESGYRPKGSAEYRNRLLPWACLNVRPLPDELSMVGGIVSTLGEGRLCFRGFETALTLLRLQERLGASEAETTIGLLVTQLVAFTLQKPVGTAWVALHPSDPAPVGPVDSRILVRELDALLRLQERFPAALDPPRRPE
jgi:hypothetical protein